MEKDEKLKGLVYLLGCYYHQDVWEDHPPGDHSDVWKVFIKDESSEVVEELRKSVKEVLSWEVGVSHKFIVDNNSGGLRLDTPVESKKWLEELDNFLSTAKK